VGAVPQRRGNTIFGRFLLPRLKGPPSPYGVIRRRRGMRKFFVLHERKTWRPELQPAFNLKFVIPVCTFNRIVCGRGSAKARKYFFGRFLLPRLEGPSSPFGAKRLQYNRLWARLWKSRDFCRKKGAAFVLRHLLRLRLKLIEVRFRNVLRLAR